MRVERGVLCRQLVVDAGVGRAVEVIHVGLVERGAWEAHEGARAEGYGGEVCGCELQMSFHGAMNDV